MRPVILASALALCPAVTAQDFIHYKFDSACTTEVINYATGPQALASNGTLQSTVASPWSPGVFGTALTGGGGGLYNRVVTGWDPGVQPVSGSLTMAWFMKERTPPGANLSYIMGAPSGGFRLFTNGVAGRGLYQRTILATGGNGVNASITQDFYLPAANADIITLAAAGWVHVAMVIDGTANTADWYVNGVSVLTLGNVTGGALINLAGPFQVGYYSSASPYDIDEFLMSFRAFSPAEMMALATAPRGGDGPYSSGIASQCGTLGLASNGRPSLGNVTYALAVTPTAPVFFDVLIGFDRCTFAATFPLPLAGATLSPLATGCWLLTDIFTAIGGVATGPAMVPLPIPPVAAYSGMSLYSQAAAIDLSSMAVSASRGLAISVGW